MLQLWRNVPAVAVVVVASAVSGAVAQAGAPREEETRHCGALPSARVVKIEAELVRCRAARALVVSYTRSAARRGACDVRRNHGACRIPPYACTRQAFESGPFVFCFDSRGARKVTFRYARGTPSDNSPQAQGAGRLN